VISFNGDSTKSGKGRQVPIAPVLADILRKQQAIRFRVGAAKDVVFTWRGRRIHGVRTAFNKARTGAGLGQDVGFQTLRHTIASWFVQNGGDLYRLQKKYFGHSTLALTARYAHLSPEYFKAGVEFIRAPREGENGRHQVDTNVQSGGKGDSVSA